MKPSNYSLGLLCWCARGGLIKLDNGDLLMPIIHLRHIYRGFTARLAGDGRQAAGSQMLAKDSAPGAWCSRQAACANPRPSCARSSARGTHPARPLLDVRGEGFLFWGAAADSVVGDVSVMTMMVVGACMRE